MMVVKVKICGITNYDDAIAAIEMGADILGFNYYPKSPRYIRSEDATAIICRLPGFAMLAGVFVNETHEKIRSIRDECNLDWIQLHGDEDPEYCKGFEYDDIKLIKAIRVKDKTDIDRAADFITDAILFDAFNSKLYGGTGETFDWNIIGDISKRVFLAGGINPDNAVQAVQTGVYGIDVCSGIESEPGKKDHKKMKSLFDNIHHLRA